MSSICLPAKHLVWALLRMQLLYFAQEVIDRFLTRMQIEATPLEEMNKRNNVEASIFQ
ncbi:MAG: hypothetical protein U0L19_08885 [Bacteroidales bacterium]|nr:hypothetical protein [Bacteroidales bacterium]